MLHDSSDGRDLRTIDLNLLVVLAALLTERHVTRAARKVGLSQSATSHALGRLRALYGDPLLVRSGRRLDLTPRAVALLPQLDRGLGELAGTIKGQPAFDPKTARRSFVLGMADYGQAILLKQLLRHLRSTAPGIDLVVKAFPNVVDLMDTGAMDLAMGPPTDLPRGFATTHLFSDGFMCVVRKGHPVVRGNRLTLEQYLSLSHLLVAPTGSPGSIVDDELARRGRSRRIAVTVTSFLVAPILVAGSDLISTGPVRLLRPLLAAFGLRALPPPLPMKDFDMHLFWHTRRDHDPAHRWLRETIAQVSQRLP